MRELSEIFLPVQRIIPFSNVEGSGNRTSIFLQGCNINCLYCHNPETIPLTSPAARQMSLAELLQTIGDSIPFIRGITVSGGEPTIYARELAVLFREVHRLGLTCYVDSNGFFDYDGIFPLIQETDRFLFDIKGTGEGLAALCFTRSRAAKPEQVRQSEEMTAVKGKEEFSHTAEYAGADTSEQVRQSEEMTVAKGKEEFSHTAEYAGADALEQVRQSEEMTVAKEKGDFSPLAERQEAADLTKQAGAVIFARNLQNLRRLLPLGKVEEVRLVYIKGFYDEKETVRQIAACLKDYPQVLFKLIRVHSKGARNAKEVALHLPKPAEAEALFAFAGEQGLTKRKLIL